VTLTWNPPSSGANAYIVEAGSFPGSDNLASFSTGNAATLFAVTDVPDGTYYVRVRAVTTAGTSAPSNEVAVVVGSGACAGPSSTPSELVSSVTGSQVLFAWRAAGGGPRSYIIEAGSYSGGTDVAAFDLRSLATSFRADSVPPGTYYVRLRAKNACGLSAPSNEVAVVVGEGPDVGPGQGTGTGEGPVAGRDAGAPAVPTGVSYSVSGSTVTLTWNAADGDATSYVVEAGSAPGAADLANLDTGDTATFLIAPGLSPGSYYVRVRAKNGRGMSDASEEIVVRIK
jgi:predicted phage tail protein